MLLRFERVHLDRHFGGAIRSDRKTNRQPPAARDTEIEIFGERIVLPAAGLIDRHATPDAGRPVEVEEPPAAIAAAVLEHEVSVEENRLNLGQQGIVLVDVAPARLHHADVRLAEMGHEPRQEITRRDEVGVEDADELPTRALEAASSAPALYPRRSVRCRYLMSTPSAAKAKTPHRELRNTPRLVGRVVQHLDLQTLARVLDPADGLDQSVGDVHFVEERQLDRDERCWIIGGRRPVPDRDASCRGRRGSTGASRKPPE